MVKNSRTAPGAGPIRPLNLPIPISVEEDPHHRPVVLGQKSRRVKVDSVEDLWQIDEEWWRDSPIVRTYYELTVQGGRRIIVFRDQADGRWYRQGG